MSYQEKTEKPGSMIENIKLKLKKVRELCWDATDGPWESTGEVRNVQLSSAFLVNVGDGVEPSYAYYDNEADAIFTAAANKLVPELADAVNWLLEELRVINNWNETFKKSIDDNEIYRQELQARAEEAERKVNALEKAVRRTCKVCVDAESDYSDSLSCQSCGEDMSNWRFNYDRFKEADNEQGY